MIVVIGDALPDREVVGHIGRRRPDAPAPVLDVTGTFDRPGRRGSGWGPCW